MDGLDGWMELDQASRWLPRGIALGGGLRGSLSHLSKRLFSAGL